MLDVAESEYIQHSRGVNLTEEGLVLSSIFDWYAADFASNTQGLLG